ncbi:cytochrome b561 [Trichinella nativa]|uniref:Cytochrome b561 n=1 Tax=Trichinella nativa TaxID=6335 RepID=A0A1Y3ER89_9BILA|nr:cytochrome b561 [Trichinella nativa]
MLAVQNRRYSLEEVDARHFKKVCVVAHILAIIELLLIGFWMNNFCGGFQWNGPPEAMFTYHPLFMTFSLQFLLGEAIMIYRMLRYAVFNSHNYSLPATPNLYTLHSWLGMTVVLIFCMQFIYLFLIRCWSSFCPEGLLANFSGLVILFYALAVVYLVVCERFRRESLPQEEEAHDLLEQ